MRSTELGKKRNAFYKRATLTGLLAAFEVISDKDHFTGAFVVEAVGL